jgi:hypothetical protein
MSSNALGAWLAFLKQPALPGEASGYYGDPLKNPDNSFNTQRTTFAIEKDIKSIEAELKLWILAGNSGTVN